MVKCSAGSADYKQLLLINDEETCMHLHEQELYCIWRDGGLCSHNNSVYGSLFCQEIHSVKLEWLMKQFLVLLQRSLKTQRPDRYWLTYWKKDVNAFLLSIERSIFNLIQNLCHSIVLPNLLLFNAGKPWCWIYSQIYSFRERQEQDPIKNIGKL